jgi:tetratricopeptide (TPR) repeat protein
MKQTPAAKTAGFVIGMIGVVALALPLFTQKDFNMDEKALVMSFKRANPLYLEGSKQFAKGNLEKAEIKLSAALEIMPVHADASFVLAQLQLKRKEFSRALASIADAEKNFASISQFHNITYQQYLQDLRQKRQDLQEQLGRMEDALRNVSSDQKGSLEEAMRGVSSSIQQIDLLLKSPVPTAIEIPADYFYIHGNILYQIGMLDDAAARYQEALRRDPRLGNAYNNLALVSFSRGRYEDALNCLLRAEGAGVKINPEFKKTVLAKIAPR